MDAGATTKSKARDEVAGVARFNQREISKRKGRIARCSMKKLASDESAKMVPKARRSGINVGMDFKLRVVDGS